MSNISSQIWPYTTIKGVYIPLLAVELFIFKIRISTQINAFNGINLYINNWKIHRKLSEFTPISVEIKGKIFPPLGSHSGAVPWAIQLLGPIIPTPHHHHWVQLPLHLRRVLDTLA